MENISAYLKKKRQEKGISLETLSDKTKIKEHILKCLEDGIDPDVGGQAYVRVMQLTFAKALGCTESEIETLFRVKEDYLRIKKTNKDSELFPNRIMFNKNVFLGILLGIVAMIMMITIINIQKRDNQKFPLRDRGQVSVEETYIAAEDELTDEHLITQAAEEQIPEIIITEQQPEQDEVVDEIERQQPQAEETEPLQAQGEPETAPVEPDTKKDNSLSILNDRSDYLSEFLSEDLLKARPLYNRSSYINTYIIGD